MNQLPTRPGPPPAITETSWIYDHDDKRVRVIGNVDDLTRAIQALGENGIVDMTQLNGSVLRVRAGNLASVAPAQPINSVTGQDIVDWSGRT